jgi:hypothetical protein
MSSGLEVGLQRLIAQHIGSDIARIEETEFIVQPQYLADRPIPFRRVRVPSWLPKSAAINLSASRH